MNEYNSDNKQNSYNYRDEAGLKTTFSSKIDILFSKKGLKKVKKNINTIIKCGTWEPITFQLVSHSWTG